MKADRPGAGGEAPQAASRYVPPALLIDGIWQPASDAGALAVVNPATEEVLASLPIADDADLDRALLAAARGFANWRMVAPLQRSEVLRRAAQLLRDRCEAIASTMHLELGKPLGEARIEVLRSAELIEWMAEEGRRTYGLTIPAPPHARYTTRLEPIGVVAAFTPWNFPAVSPARKIASSLAAGCACILKASEQTPGTATAVARAFVDAGLPPGVLNLVFGDPAQVSRRLIESPTVRAVTLTGSVPVGKELAALAARHMKPCTMELGGHAPVIVLGDVDVDKTAVASAMAKFRNAGQVCVSPTRFHVHASIHERFLRAFVEQASSLSVGPEVDEPAMGPLASERRCHAVHELVSDAQACGARLMLGGRRLGDRGFFYAPTVLADVPEAARVLHEEPFGPIAIVQPFEDVASAVARANALPFGLAAYAFTRSLRDARFLTDALEAGVIGLNSFTASSPETPFGGIKESGYGREGGSDGIRAFLTTKVVLEGSL